MAEPNLSSLMRYQTEDGRIQVQYRFEEEMTWQTQAQMAELFQVTVANVNLHLKATLKKAERSYGPEPDMARFLSGHLADEKLPPPAPSGPWIVSVSASGTAWSGPWGISYTQNLAPDMETGLGNYTEAQFVMTTREGKKQGRGRDILPPMPWQTFKNLTDDDRQSIDAYLRTVKSVKNTVPDPVIAPMK